MSLQRTALYPSFGFGDFVETVLHASFNEERVRRVESLGSFLAHLSAGLGDAEVPPEHQARASCIAGVHDRCNVTACFAFLHEVADGTGIDIYYLRFRTHEPEETVSTHASAMQW